MRPKQIAAATITCILALLILVFWPKRDPVTADQPTPPAASESNQMIEPKDALAVQPPTKKPLARDSGKAFASNPQPSESPNQEKTLWDSPLYYYGKVIDEADKPIPGVKIMFKVHLMNEAQTEDVNRTGEVKTDQSGIFKIEAPKGIGVMVELAHPGYYPYPDNPTGFDKRSLPKIGYFSDTEERAETFRMHSKGSPVALVRRQGGLHIPMNGTVAAFPFRGASRSEIIGKVEIKGTKGTPDSEANGHYDWKVSISVPDGGLAEFTNFFDFVAPTDGYSNALEIGMSKSAQDWQTHEERRVFLKLRDRFVRAEISVDVFHDLFVSMEYFVNPDGSANLESDPQHLSQGQ